METKVYNQKGEEAGKIKLPENIFDLSWNGDLVQGVVHSMAMNARKSIAHAKTRAEVRGGGKKPWRQKGTGRARHGSSRSPIWVGGGATHAPLKEKNYSRKVNKKAKTKALFVIVSSKQKNEKVLFLDNIDTKSKTKNAKEVLEALSSIEGFNGLATNKNSALIAVPKLDDTVRRSFSNFNNVKVVEAGSLSPMEVLKYKTLVFVSPEESIEELNKRIK